MTADNTYSGIAPDLIGYVESNIIPMYDGFDRGHGRDHAGTVIKEALKLCAFYDVSKAMVYTAAAYHDTGLCAGRETHHVESARIIRADKNLRRWFSENEIEMIADAAEDHRASSGHEPRTIYGRIVAEADRLIMPDTVIRRCILFGLEHYPELGKEGQLQRTVGHIRKKYGEGGYLKLWIPESGNAARMAELRRIISDGSELRRRFESIYAEVTNEAAATSDGDVRNTFRK